MRRSLWLLLVLLQFSWFSGGICCMIDPLAPIGWVKSAITTTASGVKKVVTGTASAVNGAYRLANPTTQPILIVHATAPEPPASGYRPMGCFRDKASNRDLPNSGGLDGRRWNKASCSQKCAVFGVKYFGMQSARSGEKGALECWCGHHFGKYGAGSSYDCDNRCPGEEEQTKEPCGGDLFNSVYEMK